MHKTPRVFPMVGGRKVQHLKDNIEALDISLSKQQMDYLDGLNPIDLGWPLNLIVRQ